SLSGGINQGCGEGDRTVRLERNYVLIGLQDIAERKRRSRSDQVQGDRVLRALQALGGVLLEQARKSSEQLQGNMSELYKQIKRLEWYIQTNPLQPKTERSIIGKIAELEASLVKHKALKNVRDKLLQLRVEVGALRMQAQSTHDELTKLAKESEKVHATMQETVKVLSQKKKEADSKHALFLEQSKLRHEAIVSLRTGLIRVEKIRSEIGEIQVTSTAEKAEKIRSKHKEAANEKLRSGRRLSLEEFQALMADAASDSDEE
ncbi:MAG: hypothetical protein ACLPY5_09530, partial [Candidatus Bathyarchaeia archaeon]